MIEGREKRFMRASLAFGVVLAFDAVIVVGTWATRAMAQTLAVTGPFTDAQAIAGETLFNARCATCHGEAGEAAMMTGDSFTNIWAKRTTQDIFDRIKTTMPPSDPGALSDTSVASLVAYILWANGVESGTTPLTPTTAVPVNTLVPIPPPQ